MIVLLLGVGGVGAGLRYRLWERLNPATVTSYDRVGRSTSKTVSRTPVGRWVVVGGAAVTVIALLMLAGSMTVAVPTRSVGIVTNFGRPSGETLSNGLHVVAPWSKVEMCDGSVHTLTLSQAAGDSGDPVTVRIGNGTTAGVDVTLQWNITRSDAAVELFKKYRSCGNVEDNLVRRQLQHVLNLAFSDYDPLRALLSEAERTGPTIDQRAERARQELQVAVGDGVSIGTMTVPIIHFDGPTEDRLKAFNQAQADTRIAEQRKKTAQLIADANAILASSTATHDPGVQYQNCLDLLRRLAETDQLKNLPAAFTCGAGSGTPVIIGQR